MRPPTSLLTLALFGCGGLTPAGDPVECDPSDPACAPTTTPDDAEVCDDGVDNDGDGDTDCEDNGCADDPECDADGDGHADLYLGGDDCDDGDDTVYPDAPELCDTLDNDCDDEVDEDGDGDGADACQDCDDLDPAVYPGATEVCDDLVDSDCDGEDCVVSWIEGFESGAVGNGLVASTGPIWIASANAHTGSWAAENANIGYSASSCMRVVLNYAAAGEISFWYSTDSELNYDFLRFRIDGAEPLAGAAWSGSVPWAQATYPVAAGSHSFEWCYSKDGSVDTGLDTAWVDEIIATGGLL